MEPEKFENNIKKVLGEREIKPSSDSWDKLEQRLEKKEDKKRPYLAWISSAAAIAAIFFVLGTLFNAPIASEEPMVVEETPEAPVLHEKVQEPEVIQLAISESDTEEEKTETTKRSSAERPSKNAILETPSATISEEEKLLAAENSSEAPEEITPNNKKLLAQVTTEVAEQNSPAEVTDLEVEALLLLATAELKADTTFTVNAHDLLHKAEYELEQSFRQKVFEVVKESLVKAKTAVANHDF